MTRVTRAVLIAATLGVLLAAPVTTGRIVAQQESHGQAIREAYQAWVNAANAKDLERWASFLAPNPLFLPPNHPALRGAQAIRDFYSQSFGDANFSLTCAQEQVAVAKSEDMAWSTGSCEATFTGPDGSLARKSSKWAKVWIRMSDGKWKCRLSSWSLNSPSEGS